MCIRDSYRRSHILRWLDSHEYGSLIAASLPVRRAKDNLMQVTNNYIDSIIQEMLLQFRLKTLRQLYTNGNRSLKPRIDRAALEHRNCVLTKDLRHLELHKGISEWIASILNYTRDTYYPHLKRETWVRIWINNSCIHAHAKYNMISGTMVFFWTRCSWFFIFFQVVSRFVLHKICFLVKIQTCNE